MTFKIEAKVQSFGDFERPKEPILPVPIDEVGEFLSGHSIEIFVALERSRSPAGFVTRRWL